MVLRAGAGEAQRERRTGEGNWGGVAGRGYNTSAQALGEFCFLFPLFCLLSLCWECGGLGLVWRVDVLTCRCVDDGAVVMIWGDTLSKVLNFLGTALALFLVARAYEIGSHDAVIARTVRCKYCRKSISAKATRCVNCTSWTDGRDG